MAPKSQDADNIDIIDACGYRCPMPVIRMEAGLRRLAPGASLIIKADDPLAAIDIPHFCSESGHLSERLPDEGRPDTPICVFRVTRGGNPA
ncbi:sulfurtransferase TusA family protein [Hyphococcus flavus]|uniref:Sulfurtransferase TusA family protein n=1 Tax=Hyphococcus flavus TaxID=1866326 RepID=A0AAE9ZDK7_9PROT|nr:sulfurtransferase TusA family protein [Hyphococcus flavus]WDI32824.1 sulfurtransferase TusA family protein [Hyphococcus flavus]